MTNHESWVSNVANEKLAFIIHTRDIRYEKALRLHILRSLSSTMISK